MWAANYWNPWYWASRFWSKLGLDANLDPHESVDVPAVSLTVNVTAVSLSTNVSAVDLSATVEPQ